MIGWQIHRRGRLMIWKEFTRETSDSGILEALMTLPEKFRVVLVLYYVEEYSIEEIAGVVGRTTSAVKMRLQKGRRLLEETYWKEYMYKNTKHTFKRPMVAVASLALCFCLTVAINMVNPDVAPYRFLDTFGLEGYRIVDRNARRLQSGPAIGNQW